MVAIVLADALVCMYPTGIDCLKAEGKFVGSGGFVSYFELMLVFVLFE